MKALVFNEFGNSDVLQYVDVPDATAQKGEILLSTTAIGLNFADIYRRKGNYHLVGEPPYVLGYEGAGVVVAIGEGVTEFAAGDRVAFVDVPLANAELVAVPVSKAIPIPDAIRDDVAASVLLQGLTASYLAKDSYAIKYGDVALVHAVAGGVGQMLTQIITSLGGQVIGLTSSEEKAEVARKLGAEEVLLYSDNWAEKLAGKIDVAYDSVGSTLMDSFSAVRDKGTVVFYGMSGGDPIAVDPRMLMDTSKTLTGGDLWSFLTSKDERIKRSHALFEMISSGKITVNQPRKFSLSEGKAAHDLLESRKSTGKILLIP
ncbi:quinone oxidoreductase [Listeria weihenstephanensis]|uniref:Quinone oxidoreductase n=1 Tax=Listeria weihenstephanensis TaxID=1006155 RepID=A0A841Z986_9LIST|nr:quinone oxidoreductase [Listeria weihenstephanensis]MBC1500883.1 quinone oxidoreductase [Listeria weihenstephanensis]